MLMTVSALATQKSKQIRIQPGDATNPQTFSFFTLYGKEASSWTCMTVGSGATFKFRGLPRSDYTSWHLYLPSGATFTMSANVFPVDTLIVLRDNTAGGAYFMGVTQ